MDNILIWTRFQGFDRQFSKSILAKFQITDIIDLVVC